MSETYVECLVKAKTSTFSSFLKYFLYMATGVMVIGFFLISSLLLLILAIACGIGAYFAGQRSSVEYEYLYMDKEITVDRILAQSKRKTMASYDLESVEIFAPINSYHLDHYKNRQGKVTDYSIGYEEKPDLRYAMYLENGEKIILSPSQELVKIMKNNAPRKVYTD